MHISVHLRDGPNDTNKRSQCLAIGLQSLDHRIEYRTRAEGSRADLVIQTGFDASAALKDAIDRQVPYLIMEASPFRSWTDIGKVSSWGYNGLAGGAWRPTVPSEVRSKPVTKPMKTEGGVLIIGQKPTDHSLRGSDHVGWIEEKLREYPDSVFRGHPLMEPGQGSLDAQIEEARRVVTYTSTTSVEAAVAGCALQIDGQGSWWTPEEGESREETLHRLSWYSFAHTEYTGSDTAAWVASGFEEAQARAKAGKVEIPREKVNGQAITKRYHQRIVR